MDTNNRWILAQAPSEQNSVITSEQITQSTTKTTAADQNAVPNQVPTQRKTSPLSSWLLPVLLLVFVYLILFRGPRKKQQQQKKMVQSLKRNDKVRTIGGITGTIVDVRDNEVILKIDESNNTKIKVSSGAISTKLSEDRD